MGLAVTAEPKCLFCAGFAELLERPREEIPASTVNNHRECTHLTVYKNSRSIVFLRTFVTNRKRTADSDRNLRSSGIGIFNVPLTIPWKNFVELIDQSML